MLKTTKNNELRMTTYIRILTAYILPAISHSPVPFSQNIARLLPPKIWLIMEDSVCPPYYNHKNDIILIYPPKFHIYFIIFY